MAFARWGVRKELAQENGFLTDRLHVEHSQKSYG